MLVLLNGLAGSGKDTVANYLVEKYGFVKVSFGAALKDVLSAIFGWPRELLEGDTEESRKFRDTVDEWWSARLKIPGLTPRLMMQLWGTDVVRNHFHNEMWIAACERKVERVMKEQRKNVVVTDYRFPEERSIRSLACSNEHPSRNFMVVRVERDLPKWAQDLKAKLAERQTRDVETAQKIMNELGYTDVHESEWKTLCCEVDQVVENNGTIESLHENIEKAWSEFKKNFSSCCAGPGQCLFAEIEAMVESSVAFYALASNGKFPIL